MINKVVKKISFPVSLLLLLFASPYFSSCEIDHGLGVSESRIRGHVILPDMSQRPDFFEAVRIIALTKTLDADTITLNDAVFSNFNVNLDSANPTYDLPAPLAKYEFIGAVWKHREKGWDYTKIFGFYGFDPDSFIFTQKPIYLTEENPIVENIDIVCDWIFVPKE